MEHAGQQYPDRLIKMPEVQEIVGLSRDTIYRKIKQGVFPHPKKLSAQRTSWRLSDIMRWLDELEDSDLQHCPKNKKRAQA